MIFPLSRFIQRLKDKFQLYKSEADGVQFVKPHNTSRTCHHCGHINKELEVKTRNYICPKCGKILDRDVNSAINILNRWDPGDSLENTQLTDWVKNNLGILAFYKARLFNLDKRVKEQILFEKYISKNLSKFIKEFNLRMEKYNVYFLQIIIKSDDNDWNFRIFW